MSFVLDLAPDIEAKLQQQAAQLGVTIPDLITKFVDDTPLVSAKSEKSEETHADENSRETQDGEGTPGEYTLRLAAECRAAMLSGKPYGMAAVLQLGEEIRAAIPEEELGRVPKDWAMNKNKYRFEGMFPQEEGE